MEETGEVLDADESVAEELEEEDALCVEVCEMLDEDESLEIGALVEDDELWVDELGETLDVDETVAEEELVEEDELETRYEDASLETGALV